MLYCGMEVASRFDMAQTDFVDRRNPNQKGRRASDYDAVKDVGALLRGAVETAGKAAAGAVGLAAGAAAAVSGTRITSKVNPSAEERYWLENYAEQPYYDPSYSFEDYLPAYRAGWEARARFPNSSFEQVEHELQREYGWNRGESRLLWQHARQAMLAAWEHAG
jgi:hypothetical protein